MAESRRTVEPEALMKLALEEACRAGVRGEVPVGAVAVLDGEVIARDHNRSLEFSDPTAHAEILVLRQAGRRLQNYRLSGLEIYVTVEPCAMCAGALVWSRVDRLVFGARDPKAGCVVSKASLLSEGMFNHTVNVVEGVLADSCAEILRDFFQRRRSR